MMKTRLVSESELNRAAKNLSQALRKHQARLVLAESCTGGLVAAALTQFPGISEYFCGSCVVYRDDTKRRWLNASRKILKTKTSVSREMSDELALKTLQKTPEADLCVAVTGHLGPDAPEELDGIIYISAVWRSGRSKRKVSQKILLGALPHGKKTLVQKQTELLRLKRQITASHSVLVMVRSLLRKV